MAENPIKKQHVKRYESAPSHWRLGINPLRKEWIKNITTDDIEIDFEGTYEELQEDIECFYIARYDEDRHVSEQFIDKKTLRRLCIDYVRHQKTKILRNWCPEYAQHQEISYDKLLKYYNRHRDPEIYQHVKNVVNQTIREKMPYLQ